MGVVIDLGSHSIKSGRNTLVPTSVIRSVVGYPKYPIAMPIVSSQKLGYIGEDLNKRRGILCESETIRNGVIIDWDNFENLLEYIIKPELNVEAQEECFFFTEPILNPKLERERLTSLLIERFEVLGLDFGYQPIMSLFASGKSSGMIVEMGEDLTQIVPIWEDHIVENAILRSNVVNGRLVTEYLSSMLNQRGYSFHTSTDMAIVRDMKEAIACIDPNSSGQSHLDYILPDLTTIDVSKERFQCVECLFNPFLFNKQSDGIHELIYNSFSKCPIDSRLTLYNDIVLCGGNSLISGLSHRMKEEMNTLLPQRARKRVSVGSLFSSYEGAAMYSSRSTLIGSYWITKDSYGEFGANICRRDRLSFI